MPKSWTYEARLGQESQRFASTAATCSNNQLFIGDKIVD
jgi:hypothetical protein